jgi:hypothetical protein
MGETDRNGWYTDDKLQVVRMCICNTTEGAKGGRSYGQRYAMVKEGTTVQTVARGNGGRSQHNSGECCMICYVGMYESLWAPTKERRG